MKFTYLIVSVFLWSGIASAQEKQDQKCIRLQKEVDSLVSVREFDKASGSWELLRKTCGTFNEKVYTSGADLLRKRIDLLKPEDRQPLVRDLIKLYDDFSKNFPQNNESVLLRKALLLEQYQIGTNAEIYDLLDRAFNRNPQQFSDHKAIHLYLQTYYEKFRSGDRTITASQVLQRKDDLVAHLEQVSVGSSSSANDVTRTSQALQRTVKDIATCENLDAYYSDAFEKRKTDSVWVSVALRTLSDANCRNSKMLAELTNYQQNTKPTAQSSYNLGMAAYQKARFEEASGYLVQAAGLSGDPQQKAEIYFTLAANIYGTKNRGKQKEFLDKALQSKPDFSKAYIQLAQLYADAGAECGKDAFEKKALNWMSAQTLRKAAAIDKNKTRFDKLISKYEESAPSSREIKNAKMAGKTITYGCWIKESLTVPNK